MILCSYEMLCYNQKLFTGLVAGSSVLRAYCGLSELYLIKKQLLEKMLQRAVGLKRNKKTMGLATRTTNLKTLRHSAELRIVSTLTSTCVV